MNRIKRNIPNAITCGNLLCGCLALVKIFEGDGVGAAYLVGIACVFDFFDGFMARLLKVSSPIGKDLDSLADMVTFGVVPGVMMFKLISLAVMTTFTMEHPDVPLPQGSPMLSIIGFIIPIFSAIRLAKFNNDPRQTESFIGLPTPANAIFFCSLPLVAKQIALQQNAEHVAIDEFSNNPVLSLLCNPCFLIALACIFSLLLIAPIPLFSLKFKSFRWKGNEIRFLFLGLAVIMLAFLQFIGIPLVIILYILISLINNLRVKRTSS